MENQEQCAVSWPVCTGNISPNAAANRGGVEDRVEEISLP